MQFPPEFDIHVRIMGGGGQVQWILLYRGVAIYESNSNSFFMPSCVFCTKKCVVQQKGYNFISWEESHGWPLTDIHIVSLSCSQQSTWTFQKLTLIALWGFNLRWSTLLQQRVNQYPLALLVKSSPPLFSSSSQIALVLVSGQLNSFVVHKVSN